MFGLVFPIGLTGTTLAFLMMWWMNGVDYPLVIGGKPPYSLPSMIPIMFELTILLSAFGTVFGMFHLNRLPRHHHPIFNSERFAGFSNDKFFLSVESTDPKWHIEKTRALVDECIRRARRAGATALGLHTSKSMATARELYVRMGFERAQEADFFPPGAEHVEGYRLAL